MSTLQGQPQSLVLSAHTYCQRRSPQRHLYGHRRVAVLETRPDNLHLIQDSVQGRGSPWKGRRLREPETLLGHRGSLWDHTDGDCHHGLPEGCL